MIATLDNDKRLRELEKAEHDLYRAEVDLTDKLIGFGYDTDMKSVPDANYMDISRCQAKG